MKRLWGYFHILGTISGSTQSELASSSPRRLHKCTEVNLNNSGKQAIYLQLKCRGKTLCNAVLRNLLLQDVDTSEEPAQVKQKYLHFHCHLLLATVFIAEV